MKTVSKVLQAMLTKETTPVWGGRAVTRVDGPTGMFTWEPKGKIDGPLALFTWNRPSAADLCSLAPAVLSSMYLHSLITESGVGTVNFSI